MKEKTRSWMKLVLNFSVILLVLSYSTTVVEDAYAEPHIDIIPPHLPITQGEYLTIITYTDLAALGLDPVLDEAYLGLWKLKLSGPHYFQLWQGNKLAGEGEYVEMPTQILFYSNNSFNICPPIENGGFGLYIWVFDGKFLTLNEVGEDCDARSLILTTHPLLFLN